MTVAFQVGHHVPDGARGRPDAGVAAFCAAVAQPGARPVVISECEIPVPAVGWELRASGLWADHVCETPLDHWSYGLEAFALAIDDPAELLGRGFGDRTPLGWELEFEAAERAVALDAESYVQAGAVHGLVLFAHGEVEVEGRASRSHRWGGGDRRGIDACLVEHGLDLGEPATVEIALPTVDAVWWVAPTAHGVRSRTEPTVDPGGAVGP